jgi:hypothetical protein
VEPGSYTPPFDAVVLDSVSLRDTVGTVFVSVRSGENFHREDFSVRLLDARRGWSIQEVRIWGAMRLYRRRAVPPA